MRLSGAEIEYAVRFWAIVFFGIGACILLGREIVVYSSPVLSAVVVGSVVALVTFYSPKLSLGLVVFAMLLSPKLQGAQIADTSRHGAVLVRFDDVLLMIIFCSWLGRTALMKGSAFLIRTPINMPIFLYTAVYVISTIFSIMRGDIQPLRSFFYVLKYVEYFFLFFMSVNIIEDEADVVGYLWCAWLTAIIVTIYGYFQIPGGYRVIAPFEDPITFTEKKTEEPGEPNTLGGYYIVVFAGLLGFYTQGSVQSSMISIISLVFMLAPFAMTLSRASWTGVLGSVAFLMALTPRRRLQLLFGIGMVAILLFSVTFIRENIVNRVLYTFTAGGDVTALRPLSLGPFGVVMLEPSTYDRVGSWRRIFTENFPQHPIFGAGVTAVGLSDAQYPLILGEAGLLGLSLFFWMIYRIWHVASHLFKNAQTELQRALGMGTMVALIGLLIQGMGANTFIIVRIMEPFWFLVALSARCYVNLQSKSDSLEQEL